MIVSIVHAVSRSWRKRQQAARRSAYTLVELLVVVTIIGILLALLMPAIQAARESARRAQCADHLKQLALACHSFHSIHGKFPMGSTLAKKEYQMGYSWVVYCLPYLEEQTVADQLLKQGRSIAPPIAVLFCPSDATTVGSASDKYEGSYFGAGGAGKDPSYVIDLEDKLCGDIYTDGVFFPGSKIGAKDVTDGLTHTLAIGERSYAKHLWPSGAYWVGGADRWHCTMSSKNVRWPINSPATTSGYFVSDPDAPANMRTMRLNDLYFGSQHPGGAWFAFAGGNLEFIADDIAFSVYQDLASRNGGEPTQ